MKKLLIGILMLLSLALCVSANPILDGIGNKEVNESSTLTFNITNSAPDNGSSVYTKNVTFGTLTKLNNETAQFSWTPNYDGAGVYSVEFNVSDDDSTDTESITITVNNVNRAPTINLPSSETIVGGYPEMIDLDSYASDLDGDNLTYSVLAENISQVDCEIDDGTLTMIAADNFTGTALCKVEVSDSYLNANDTISITVQSPNPSVSIADVDLGDASLNSTTSQKSFTISNNGNIDLNNIGIVWDSSYDKYKINFTGVASTLTAGGSDTSYVKITIPADQNTGSITIPVKFTSDELNKTFNLKAYVIGRLIIDDLDVEVGDNTHSNLGNGDKIKENAEPEDDVTFNFKIKNDFTDDEDIEIRDIVVKVTIEEIDLGDDLEEESDEFDLDAEKSKSVDIKFKVPLKVQEETYTVRIEVTGEDENKVDHKVEWTLELEVDKKSHDVRIRSASLAQSVLQCSRSTTLDINLMNLGGNDEDEVTLEATNSNIGLNFVERDIYLSKDPEDDDNEYKKTIPINLASNAKAGRYPITVRAYFNDDVLDDVTTLNLEVKDCVTVTEKEEEVKEEEKVEVITEKENLTEISVPILPEKVTESKEKSFKDSAAYIVLLTGVAIIVILLLTLIIVNFLVANRK